MKRLDDRFTLERELGSGGMAHVYRGTDEVLDRPVAVKVLKTGFDGEDIAARFQREGRTAARLSHPNIVQVYDAGEDEVDGREVSYIVMEYVSGGDLKRLIDERGPLSRERLAHIGAGVAAGLAHAHGRGVIHRDIKPHNILLDENGDVKLTDFGIARALDSTQATRTGSYLGTALYSSPEQLRGEKATTKSDVYSLGVTLYQAATGKTPFTGNAIEVANQHISRGPAPIDSSSVNIGNELEALILSCLAKDPALRPDASELRRRLSKTERDDSPTRAYAAPLPRQDADETRILQSSAPVRQDFKRPRRNRVLKGTIAALALFAVVVIAVALIASVLYVNNTDQPVAKRKGQGPDSAHAASAGKPVSKQPTQQAKQQNEEQAQHTTPPKNSAGGSSDGDLTKQAAAKTVLDMYVSAARGNYGASYSLLSQSFRQNTSREGWAQTFTTLQRIEFVNGPTARVSGNTATVTGTTIATHTYGNERNVGTWTLVNEGGKWKVSGISVRNA